MAGSNIASETTTSRVCGSVSAVNWPSGVVNDWYIVTFVNICSGDGGCSSMIEVAGATENKMRRVKRKPVFGVCCKTTEDS